MRIKSFLLLSALCSTLSAQITGPYLQAPTATSVMVTWKTSSNNESVIAFGTDSTALDRQANGNCEVLSDTGYNNNYFYHSVRLTGLEPDQFYYYRVITGSLRSAIHRFRTQPSAGSNPDIYRVLVFGDHQVRSDDRYERLLKAARAKVLEKFGGSVEEHINLVLNDGDQVDQGTLDHYEFVHMKPSAVLSGNLPFMTTVGNHETYGTLGLSAYYQHFFYDDLGYKGIPSPGSENYYSYQQGNVVFIHLSSEHPEEAQTGWVRQIIDSVKSDSSVKWVISLAHRPIQAEQYVGDISTYVRDQIIPILTETDKSVLLITGHHHLYARGQLRDYPMYHIISGGASWDQHWGQSTEKDFDDVQKTIDSWNYQIITFNNARNEMSVETWSIGSPLIGPVLDNLLIDSFYRKPGATPPSQPSISNQPDDSISLPYTFSGAPYSTVTSEPLNSTQFQISPDNSFSKPLFDLIRDFENLYGSTGAPDHQPVDIHEGLDILEYKIERNKLPNGTWFIRTRHRDRNMEWSEWSDAVEFKVKGSTGGFTRISSDKSFYEKDEDIIVTYEFGPGNAKDWIGIYKWGDTPGPIPSTDWEYTSGTSGTVKLQVSQPGRYFIGFFENDGYEELCSRITVYAGTIPVLTLSKAGYSVGEGIRITYSNAPGLTNDWIGIYQLGDVPGVVGSTLWKYTSGTSGILDFTGLAAGYYFATYFLEDQYTESCDRIIFSVGTDLAEVRTDKTEYTTGESIRVDFEDGPGTSGDWIGLLRQNPSPGTAPLVAQKSIANMQAGNLSFDSELDPGAYYLALFINNSSIRISNKANLTVVSGNSSFIPESASGEMPLVFPSPTDGRFRVKSSMLADNDLSIKILAMTGEVLLEKQLRASNSTVSEEIDFSHAPAGIYMMSILTGDCLWLSKFVVE